MREPGTSFEFDGITLHVIHQPLTGSTSCHGCYADGDEDACRLLRGTDDDTSRLCGHRNEGVVFVENVEAFKTNLIAFKLTQ